MGHVAWSEMFAMSPSSIDVLLTFDVSFFPLPLPSYIFLTVSGRRATSEDSSVFLNGESSLCTLISRELATVVKV